MPGTPRHRPDFVRTTMIALAVILSVIGVAAASNRFLVVATRGVRHGAIAATDTAGLPMASRWRNLPPGSPGYEAMRERVLRYPPIFDRYPIGLAAVFFLYCCVRGFVAIRQGRRAEHREWMIRMYATGLGVSSIRLVSFPLVLVTQWRLEDVGAVSIWIGMGLCVAAGEIWIRRTRVSAVAQLAPTPA